MAKYYGLPFNLQVSKNLTQGEKALQHKSYVAKHLASKKRAGGAAAAVAGMADDFLPLEGMAPGAAGAADLGAGLAVSGANILPKAGSRLGSLLKWGGRAAGVAGLGLTALAVLEGIRKEREGGIVDALRGLDEGSKAAQLEMALQSEQSLNSRLGVMEGAAGRLERDAATRQGFDEAELMAMLRDRAGELDAIAERYQPDLATRMARLGVL